MAGRQSPAQEAIVHFLGCSQLPHVSLHRWFWVDPIRSASVPRLFADLPVGGFETHVPEAFSATHGGFQNPSWRAT